MFLSSCFHRWIVELHLCLFPACCLLCPALAQLLVVELVIRFAAKLTGTFSIHSPPFLLLILLFRGLITSIVRSLVKHACRQKQTNHVL